MSYLWIWAVLILGIDALIKPGTVPVYVSVALAVVVTTVLEYITDIYWRKISILKPGITVMRNLISMDEFVLNFHFCGEYSRICWLTFIHPVISAYVRAIDPSAKQVIALLMLVMIIADTVKTLLKQKR